MIARSQQSVLVSGQVKGRLRLVAHYLNKYSMNSLLNVAVILAAAVAIVWADEKITPSEQCPGESFDGLQDRIQVIPCGKSRCKLQKGANTTVIFKFKPAKVVNELVSDVYADIAGIPLPFIGVTGVSACANVKHADTGAPAPCPLAAGQEYIYTNTFFIEPFYPTVSMRVHWSLNDGDTKIICFEVPAAIIAAKKSDAA